MPGARLRLPHAIVWWSLFAVMVLNLAAVVICAFTPLVWTLQGRGSEQYPELVFIFYGLPAAVLGLICSAAALAARTPIVGWAAATGAALGLGSCLYLYLSITLNPPGLGWFMVNFHRTVLLALTIATLVAVGASVRAKTPA